ncbi:uncharacterized protein LOC109847608 [Asparagus officinalis]|uniref:uncharacterized protein LOC109847608 n=1 Tax=Asparagus officinalis TaxID=4686 RepID=UPI00098E85C6|nr:uncharacterized protein LOC109847608 [Asparagus officinalis]
MYKDLKLNFWWHGMKRDVAHSVAKCLVCQQVKAEHQRIAERTIQILDDMLRACMRDFHKSWEDHLYLVEFAYNNSLQESIGMTTFAALYGRKCCSSLSWDDVGEREIFKPELIDKSVDVVRIIWE